MIKKNKERFPQNSSRQAQVNPPKFQRKEAGHPNSVYQQAFTMQRAIGNRAYQSLLRSALDLNRETPVRLRNIPGRIARATKSDLAKNLVEQIDPFKSTGDIDQDTGNCMLGAKLILLKLKGSFYWEQVSKPVVNGQYIVAKPGHYYVIFVREISATKIKADQLDPLNSEVTETEPRRSGLKLYSLLEK